MMHRYHSNFFTSGVR